ncbi:MAG: hypothetical protein E6J25_03655 [Chloroflexi bacterium]|nr:MAG: hypothetical protein E6J25_03655 [Chloroflexota bacterium]
MLLGSLVPSSGGAAAGSSGTPSFVRQIASGGTTSFRAGAVGTGAIQSPEFATLALDGAAASSTKKGVVNRRLSTSAGPAGAAVASANEAGSDSNLLLSFDGLNHRAQRTANGGNQFSLEPPDQGLCVGNGYVLETVNDVLRVFSTGGAPVTGVIDLNSFYGYAAQVDRTTGQQGPFVTDPSCYFDADTQRWFHVVLTLDVDASTGALLGPNHLDLAVSNGRKPTDGWRLYSVPVQDDGTQGTPNHGCSLGACIGDYPHIGADANGFYITTNEYSLFGPEFKGAQLYAFSKRALARHDRKVTVVQFDTRETLAARRAGFTVWPASSPASQYATSEGGTEYFLSSDAGSEVNPIGTSTNLVVWALTQTQSLNSGGAGLRLTNTVKTVSPYSVPATSVQKVGHIPLGECINDQSIRTPLGQGCWRYFFTKKPRNDEVESRLDSNDSRMQQVVYAGGKLYGALDTALSVDGANQAGIEWFIVSPSTSSNDLSGYLGLAGANLTYPAIGVTAGGKGVMAFTLVGANDYPSAAYAPISAASGVGDVVHVAKAGLGPDDGFTSYKAFVGNPPRTRWGDYGAAVADGPNIWMASEYIGQTCTLAEYVATTPIGICGATRTALGNWDTRISLVSP